MLAAAALFGTTGTVLVNAPEGAEPWSVGCLRLLVGGLTLAALAAGGRADLRAPWRREALGHTLLSVTGVAVFQSGYFLAVHRTGVAVGTVVTIGSGPVIAGTAAALRARRRPGTGWTVGTLAGVAGVGLLGLTGRTVDADATGVVLAIAAGAGWAVFSAADKALIDRGLHSTSVMAATFLGGGLALSPALLAHSPSWTASTGGAAVALYLGVATVGVAYHLYGWALRHLAAPVVITLTLLEPITAATLGAVVVHEPVGAGGWVGVALVVAGLLVTGRSSLTATAGVAPATTATVPS